MADFAAARLNMVESQVRTADVTDVRIHDAMRALPREDFMPPAKSHTSLGGIPGPSSSGAELYRLIRLFGWWIKVSVIEPNRNASCSQSLRRR